VNEATRSVAVNEATRSVGVNLARRFNAGRSDKKALLVA